MATIAPTQQRWIYGPVRDLRPSLAEWISSDRNVAVVWSSLLFVVGLILTVRRSLLR